jgi:hypothetical protein
MRTLTAPRSSTTRCRADIVSASVMALPGVTRIVPIRAMSMRAESDGGRWSGRSTASSVSTGALEPDPRSISAGQGAPAVHVHRHDQYAVTVNASIATAAAASAHV